MKLSFNEVVEAVKGKVVYDSLNNEFNKLSTDTRNIKENNLFLALKGANFNGNEYLEKAFLQGATVAIVSEIVTPLEKMKVKGTIILVEDTRLALGDLARYYREKLGVKVIGITGSVGKTSTKDVVAAFVSGKFNVFKTKGNFNNDIGLPLMILDMDEDVEVAVLEMGMNNLKEIEYLADIARPEIGIITNIGVSHIENLKTQDNILKAKMEITTFFDKNNILILNGEDEYLKKVQNNCYEIEKIGYNQEYDIKATEISLFETETKFIAEVFGDKEEFTIKMPGKHNVLNALLAIAASKRLGLSIDEMKQGLKNFEATSMRLQIIDNNSIKVINDCYNASPSSMMAAIDVLSNYKDRRKVAILGTMFELGNEAYKCHKEVGEYASKKCDLVIAIGEFAKAYKEGYNNECIYCFENKEEAINKLKSVIKNNDAILVKASRGAKFEEIVKVLETEKYN